VNDFKIDAAVQRMPKPTLGGQEDLPEQLHGAAAVEANQLIISGAYARPAHSPAFGGRRGLTRDS
jgi:hypothetical protein